MNEYIILGLLQGIFEWLPVSSEGIVAVTSSFLAKELNPVDVAIFLHLGTLLAVMIYFWRDWKDVLLLKDKGMIRFLLIASFISLIVGLPIYYLVRSIGVGGWLLILTGVGLLFTAYFNKAKKSFGLEIDKVAGISGFLQGLAIIPGMSRSGSTIFGLSLGKLKPEEILKYSYMMSAPVIIVAGAFVALTNPMILAGWPALLTSFIAGLLSLSLLMKLAKKINFFYFASVFAILCLVGGAVVLVF